MGGSVEQPQNGGAGRVKAPIAANAHGPIRAMGGALGEVALRPDQRTEIEKSRRTPKRGTPLSAGRKDLMLAFADQGGEGSIDRAALTGKLDKITADMERSRNDDRAALVKLHDLLDKQQRNEFVDALEKNFKAKHGLRRRRRGGSPPRMGFGPHAQARRGPEAHRRPEGQDQDDLQESWRGEHEEAPRRQTPAARAVITRGGKHALEGVPRDKLDLDKRVAPPQDLKAMANGGVEHVAKIAEKVLPILTPEQPLDRGRQAARDGQRRRYVTAGSLTARVV